MGKTSDQKKIKTPGSPIKYEVIWISNSSCTDYVPLVILKKTDGTELWVFHQHLVIIHNVVLKIII